MTWHPARERHALGPWSFELAGDEIAHLRFRGREVLRSIRAVTRDEDWGTPPFTVDEVVASAGRLTLALRGRGDALHGAVTIAADDETFTAALDLAVESDVLTNRTGLVVLHPAAVAGAPLVVTHTDGTTELTAFPAAISPHQPAFDVAALEADGVTVAFRGEVFEMEDQRNWTDASFKTYSRPLAQPFPYVLTAGDRVRQTVTVTARGIDAPAPPAAEIVLTEAGVVPDVGTAAATSPDPAPELTPLGAHVLVELDLASTNWRAALERAARSGRPLDVRLIGAVADLPAAVDALAGLDVARIAAFAADGDAIHVSDAALAQALRTALRARDLPVVVGTRAHFTELNREQHRLPSERDGVAFSSTPLFHAENTDQLVESLAMQRLTALQAVDIAAGSPVHVGPVTLRPRFNNVATTPGPAPTRADLGDGYGAAFGVPDDARQDAPEFAAWTVASAAAFGVPGVASLTFFEEWGPRGIAGCPVERALRSLAETSGRPLLSGPSPDGLVWAIGARRADGTAVVHVANLDSRERAVDVRVDDVVTTVTISAGGWTRLVRVSAPRRRAWRRRR